MGGNTYFVPPEASAYGKTFLKITFSWKPSTPLKDETPGNHGCQWKPRKQRNLQTMKTMISRLFLLVVDFSEILASIENKSRF